MEPKFSSSCTLFEDMAIEHQDGLPFKYSNIPKGTVVEECDGLPRSLPDLYFTSPNLQTSEVEQSLDNNMLSCLEWTRLNTPGSQYDTIGDCSGISQNKIEGTPVRFFRASPDDNVPFRHVWQQTFGSTLAGRFGEEPGLPGDYVLGSLKEPSPEALMECKGMDFASLQTTQDIHQQRIGRCSTIDSHAWNASPPVFHNTPPIVDVPLFGGSDEDEGQSEKRSVVACGERFSDEPYAKLIYRALLGAPNHSMVLQEIYQWFINNTDKGNSGSSGWRNSIRHNLSMNAAFRKTDRTPVGEESKKSSEWVLEPFAIQKGVTPTTRYRKHGKKTIKSDHPAPARVRSGRAGGLSAGKTKFHRRRSHNDHQEMYVRRAESQVQRCLIPGLNYHHIAQSDLGNHGLGTKNPYYLTPPSLDNCIPLEEAVELHMGVAPLLYVDRHEPFGNRNSYMWPKFHC